MALSLATLPALADIIPITSLQREGTATIVGGTVLRLTPNFDPNPLDSQGNPTGNPPAGAAWTKTTYDVKDAFTASFDFRMWDPCNPASTSYCHLDGDGSAGDGIAFVIQNSKVDASNSGMAGASGLGDTALGRGAGGMGFMGIYDSVAVMLDTYQNNYFYGDPNGNYIGVNTRGSNFNVPHHFCKGGVLTSDPTKTPQTDLPGVPCTADPSLGMTGKIPGLLDDGNVHNLAVVYVPGTLNIFLDSKDVLTIDKFNFVDTLGLSDGTAFLGFTAGTRGSYQNQDILDFTITPEPVAGQLWIPLAMIVAAVVTRKWQRNRS